MSVFVNYDGPKLDSKQKQVVRSRVMVLVRGQQKQAKCKVSETASSRHPRSLAPAPNKNANHPDVLPVDDSEHARQGWAARQQQQSASRSQRDPAAVARRQRINIVTSSSCSPWHLGGILVPPRSTHATGVDARTFQDYLGRCGAYSSYLDEAFVLVGFRQPSYFRPDLSKAACIYIGWLLTAGVLDAFRGAGDIAYPYYEYQAVRELQKFIDGAGARELHQVVYPVVILGMFEMVRFSPRAITHLSAVENFIKSRGGLRMMPDVMQHLVIMADTLQCVCFDTPLAFNLLGRHPTMHLMTADGMPAGNQLRSCPLLLCDDEDLSLAGQYVEPAIRVQTVAALQAASDSFRQFFGLDVQSPTSSTGRTSAEDDAAIGRSSDAIANNPSPPSKASRLLLDTCALTARIMRRTSQGNLNGLDDTANELDVLRLYENTRFIGLKAWAGLPYVYVWVNLIGFAASTDSRMRSYFIAEVVRCAFSYGCYQMEVFQAVLKNFLHLRNAIAARKLALASLQTVGTS